jgi:hypothetical protein
MPDPIKLISVVPDCPDAGALAAGAAKYDVQPGDHFRVYADPAGHPFCLCVEDEPGQG